MRASVSSSILRLLPPPGEAIFIPPPQVSPEGTFSRSLEDALTAESTRGHNGYSPWREPGPCVEVDFRAPHPEPMCEVVVVVKGVGELP